MHVYPWISARVFKERTLVLLGTFLHRTDVQVPLNNLSRPGADACMYVHTYSTHMDVSLDLHSSTFINKVFFLFVLK